MTLGFAVAAFFGGWCGSVPLYYYIIWLILRRKLPIPPPPPDPFLRDWLISKVLGAVGGLVTAYGYWVTFGPQPEPWRDGLGAVAFSIIGFFGGRFASELYGAARSGRSIDLEQAAP